jgi:hypothetical protein
MNHTEWNDIFALGDDADPDDRKKADEHLLTCDECQKVKAGFELFKEALLDDSEEEDDPKVREQVLAAAQAQLDGWVRARARRVAFLVTLALGLLVVGVVVWYRSKAGPVERRLELGEEQLTHGDFEGARKTADEVLSAPDLPEAEKARALRLKERAR